LLLGGLEAGLGAVEGVEGAGDVESELGTGEALGGAAYRVFGALRVNLVGMLGALWGVRVIWDRRGEREIGSGIKRGSM